MTETILFETFTHRKPTLDDMYLVHQQGVDGATEHVSHPDRLAWRSMCATNEGKEKGEKSVQVRDLGQHASGHQTRLEERQQGDVGRVCRHVARARLAFLFALFGGRRELILLRGNPPLRLPHDRAGRLRIGLVARGAVFAGGTLPASGSTPCISG